MDTRPAPGLDIVDVASAAAGVAPAALAAAIANLQAAAIASRERVMGAIVATGAPAGTTAGATITACPQPPVGPPFVTTGASALAGPVVSAVGTLAVVAIVDAPAGTAAGAVIGHSPVGLPFLAAGASALAGIAAGAAGSLDAAATVGAPAGTAAGALDLGPPQLSLVPPLGRPLTRPWAELCTDRRGTPSFWHPSMAF
jgi:hypothetical protein